MTDIKLGFVDYTTLVFIPDPASTDGSGKTGLVAANLTVSYTRVETDNDVAVTDVTGSLSDLAALTTAHTDWGLKEVSNTLAPGLYRLDIADAVFASGAWSAVVYVMITTSAAAASPMKFDLVAFDRLDTVRMGLTALPNAAADAAGGLVISDAGGLDADAQRADVAAILVDTGTTLDARIPAALVSGRMDASVGAMAANVMTAAAAAADLTTELQSGLATAAALTTVSGKIDVIDDFLDTEIATLQTSVDDLPTNAELATSQAAADDATLSAIAALSIPTTGQIADAVWDEAIAGHAGVGSTGAALSAAGSAGDPWSTALPGAYGAGTAGKIIGDNINATVSSRASQASVDTVDDFLDTEIAAILAAVDTEIAAIKTKTDLIPGTQYGKTYAELVALMGAALLGKASGLGTATATFRKIDDSADAIVATVDASGNRSAVTLTP